ncbi:hypothetical protein [Clostridium tunisiense]|uniref:hypothetical protein n=1 Tax=Clostridium tunisiense TaxID=219748 RepID=UPI0002DED320|nr:hypothetical protein [Clostridium tunisiense]
MNEMLQKVLHGVLAEEKITRIVEEYDKNKDVPLGVLGIDSLCMMGIVLNINNLIGGKINFDNFKFEDIETLSKIKLFIEKCNLE